MENASLLQLMSRSIASIALITSSFVILSAIWSPSTSPVSISLITQWYIKPSPVLRYVMSLAIPIRGTIGNSWFLRMFGYPSPRVSCYSSDSWLYACYGKSSDSYLPCIRHISCANALALSAQCHSYPIWPVCPSAFVEHFLDFLFEIHFPLLKCFPFPEPCIISGSLSFKYSGPLHYRVFGMPLYEFILYFWWLAK